MMILMCLPMTIDRIICSAIGNGGRRDILWAFQLVIYGRWRL